MQVIEQYCIQAWTAEGWKSVGKLWAADIRLVHQAVDDHAKSNCGGAFRGVAKKDNEIVAVTPIIAYGSVNRVTLKNRRH